MGIERAHVHAQDEMWQMRAADDLEEACRAF